ncbi:MAG TPA: O-antigen ligase family protein [Flavitalea sp.]|nr:O-antigen ligase family protein [Flavitalea sp.]
MKKLFFIEDSLSNKITYYHLLFFIAFLPFDLFFSEVILISLSIHTLINLNLKLLKGLIRRDVIIVQGIFILTFISCLYTFDRNAGFSLLSRQLAILIFPIILFVTPLNLQQYRSRLLSAFAIVCALTITYLYFDAIRVIRFNHLPFKAIFSNSFINHNFSLPIRIHATYLSMYCALSLCYLLFVLFHTEKLLNRYLILTGVFILSAGLMQLASKSVIITSLICACIIIPLFLNKRNRLVLTIALTLPIVTGSVVIFNMKSFHERFISDLTSDLKNRNLEFSVSSTRMQRWLLGWELFTDAPVFGHGSGEELQLLRNKYFDKGLYHAFIFRLNAHNQYLSLMIKSGILGLLIYGYILFYGIQSAIRHRDSLFLCFLLFVIIVSLSENLLDVNKGIFFYAFFFSFFLVGKNRPDHTLNQSASGNQKLKIDVFNHETPP